LTRFEIAAVSVFVLLIFGFLVLLFFVIRDWIKGSPKC
jgi:hypothetical protein